MINPNGDDIRKFENPLVPGAFNEQAALVSSKLSQMPQDQKRKQERIHYLKILGFAVKQHPKVKIKTSLNPKYSCAICG